jgi:hypothetical protein
MWQLLLNTKAIRVMYPSDYFTRCVTEGTASRSIANMEVEKVTLLSFVAL